MSWMEELNNVYGRNQTRVGEFEERRNQRMTLLPVSHVMQSAQIEVLLTAEGEFLNAKVIEKENARTIVPATPSSANRSNSSAPHFLHDKLVYVAGDFTKFGGDPKYKEHHPDYLKQMKAWNDSPLTNRKVRAIYRYVSKGRLIEDLIDAHILPTNERGKILEKWPASSKEEKPMIYKVVTGDASTAFVRFDVYHETANDPVVWEDRELFRSFIEFLEHYQEAEKGICYVTGEKVGLTTRHGSRIRNAGDMSKLISANDDKGFTYRGRFAKPTEAVQIGYETSQKAHHALRWLIQRQGTYVDTRYFVAFGIEHADVASPFASTRELIEQENTEWDDLFTSEFDSLKNDIARTEELVAGELNKAIQGMRHSLKKEDLEDIIVMALDAATTGRLAIVYYQRIEADLFYDAIQEWHHTCRWLQSHKDDKTNKIHSFVGTPSTYRIAEAVYGSKADSRMKKELYTRLLPCIVERKRLPNDIVRIIFNRVKNPFSFTNSTESWNATVNIACALTAKYYEEEGYGVALMEENNQRDYLFGRLLGLAEVMESRILKERDEKRATNATRYFNAFTQHPARTWLVIRKQLTPYFQRSWGNAGYFSMLIQKIEDRLTNEQMTDDPLGPIFLLGYSSQIQELYTKKGEKEHVDTES